MRANFAVKAMKYLVLVGALVMTAAVVFAEEPSAKESVVPANPTSAAAAAWTKLKADLDALKHIDSKSPDADKQIAAMLGEARDFAAKYPTDPNAWNANMLWAQIAEVMNRDQVAGAPSAEEIDHAYDRVLADKYTPKEVRGEITAMRLLGQMVDAAEAKGDASAQWKTVDSGLADFQKQYGPGFSLDGQTSAVGLLREKEITLLSSVPATPATHDILENLSRDPDPEVAQLATMGLDRVKLLAGLRTKPLELKFTAADGREVDVSKLRGKVVLLDFWATWCGPCVAKIPEVVDTFKKYHDKGLEIVGVSLDEDKQTMQSFAQRKEMTWPQYFDGQRFDNKISKGFDIDSIPAMWLLDKKGMLVSTDAAEGLQGQVERLLNAP
jgi:thiol-disulfide isomerase/thioredoxin